MGFKTNSVMVGIVTLIVAIIIIFNVVGNSANNITDAADAVQYATNCSDGVGVNGESLYYNSTLDLCVNDSKTGANCRNSTATHYNLPIESLFGASGVLLLVFMAGLLLFVVRIVLKKHE